MKKNLFTVCLSCMLLAILTPSSPAFSQPKDQDTSQLESQSTLPQIKKAAEEGDPDAQYALGYMYYYGKGVSQDMMSARQWIKKAADQGQQQAVQAEKILLGSAPSIQPTVNPVAQPNGASPDQPNTPVAPREDMKKEPVVAPKANPKANQDPRPLSDILTENRTTPNKKKAKTKKRPLTSEKSPEKPKNGTTKITPSSNPNEVFFAIQLLSSSKKEDILRFLAKSNLKQANYYETQRNGQKWYVVIYGQYPSRKAAIAAIQRLPESVKKNTPWVKSSAMINKEKQKKS